MIFEIAGHDPKLKPWANLVPKLEYPQCLRILTLRTNIEYVNSV